MGTFRDISKRATEICHFQNGNSRRPCYKSDNKCKALRSKPSWFPSCSVIL